MFGGFSLAASWGEDDFWEVAARYTGEFGGFKLLGGIGYSAFTDENTTVALPTGSIKDSNFFQVGGYAQHIATGLFVHAAYGREDNSDTQVGLAGLTPPNSDHWYVKAGIRQKWTPLGATIVYGDYAEYHDQVGPVALTANGATGSELQRFGGGLVQELDAAAMTVYLKYQHYEGEFEGAALNPALANLEDIDFVSAGALINF